MFGYGCHVPRKVKSLREDERKLAASTGDAGRDGYSVLSRADREMGTRPSVGSQPDYSAGPRFSEDY